jgi:hypothetical protein
LERIASRTGLKGQVSERVLLVRSDISLVSAGLAVDAGFDRFNLHFRVFSHRPFEQFLNPKPDLISVEMG